MDNAVIAFTNSKGIIKSVSVSCNGGIDDLGFQLLENFKDTYDVRDLIITSIDYIEDGEVEYICDIDETPESYYEFEEFDSKEDFINEMETCSYYLYEKNKWYVWITGSNSEERELEEVLDDES